MFKKKTAHKMFLKRPFNIGFKTKNSNVCTKPPPPPKGSGVINEKWNEPRLPT